MEQIGILGMSLEASLLILAIVVIRSLFLHRLPKATFIALWGVAAARLLLPFKIPSGLSVYSLLGRLAGGSPTVTVVKSAKLVPIANGAAAQPLPGFTLPPPEVLWIVGFALCAAFFAINYVSCVRRFSASLPVESSFISGWLCSHKTRRAVKVRQSDTVASPLTYGVLKPVILLPSATDFTDDAQLTYILAHEHTHIRRFDAAAKLLLALVVSLHWFNPAVWVMYILANRDLELCCDEYAVRSLGENAKSLYALALIGMAEKKSGLMPLCSGFCKTAAEERIVSIMKIRKTSAWSVALALALVTSTCAVFATSAKAPEKLTATPLTESASSSTALVRINEKTGTQEMSIDNGKTWDKLNASDPDSASASSDIVWWTADEYAKWLEQEKKDLQSLVGTGSGYTGNGVYHEWTQEHVDETIAMYEDTLNDIKKGIKISKTVDGRDDIAISMSPSDNVSLVSGSVFSMKDGDEVAYIKSLDIDASTIKATKIEGNANVAEVKDGVPVKFTKLTESADSIPATEITIKATTLEKQDSVPMTELTKSASSVPATKITESAKKVK